ncbi:hypothetical protein GCM10010532_090310 [Dactylosporangium siamense]|uniref:Uncharacterized protein n=1 Tax=Dactylosporangium siamense TaxID=685454 RepID=A0A919UDN6_9ACTN|nr:hypothetical protein Dsi01nite_096950 [Dactylosporangium siamense]
MLAHAGVQQLGKVESVQVEARLTAVLEQCGVRVLDTQLWIEDGEADPGPFDNGKKQLAVFTGTDESRRMRLRK